MPALMEKKEVLILFGGRSVEHGVSINSARNIFEHIDRGRFTPRLAGITTDGTWFLKETVDKDISQGKALRLGTSPAIPELFFDGGSIRPQLAFPVLHGTDGEDGSIQGLLTAMNLPFVGSGVLGSALSMNKIVAKEMLQAAGLPVVPFVHFRFDERDQIDYRSLVNRFGSPMMVKSASLGSSVGVSKVKTEEDFRRALDDSFSFDDEVIIEQYIPGREIECAILGNDPPMASLPGEIVISPRYEFYSFDAKYVDPDAVEIRVPAALDPHEQDTIRELSVKAFQTLHCLDFARVDLFVSKSGIFVNEINTIPGFTNSSMFPMMWKERGISFTDLISRLLDLAAERTVRQQRVQRNFESSLRY